MKNRNTHFLSMLIILLIGTTTGFAQSLPIGVFFNSGETLKYDYSDNPIITFDDHNITIKVGKSSNDYQISNVKKVSFMTYTESLSINPKNVRVLLGETTKLDAIFSPEDATDTDLVWTSSDETVATVSSTGEVKAVGVGSVEITATLADNSSIKATCSIEVYTVITESINFSLENIEVNLGETTKLDVIFTPENAVDTELIWASSDETVATVSSTGEVKGVGTGTALITASLASNNDIKATCSVEVSENAEDKVVNPVAVTRVSTATPDDIMYVESATSWVVNQGGLSDGKFGKYAGPYMLVKFDLSDIKNFTLTKAVLNFDSEYTGSDNKNTNMCVALMDDTSWNAQTATFTNVEKGAKDLFTSSWTVKGVITPMEYDIKEFIDADEDKVLAFVIYTGTAREHEVSNLHLTISYTSKKVKDIEYAINAVDGEGNVIKELESGVCKETDNKIYYSPYAVVDEDGKWYVIGNADYTDYAHPVGDGGTINIKYILNNDIVSFVDFNNGEKSPYCSGGAYGYVPGASSYTEGASFGDITSGIYVAIVRFISDGHRELHIRDASDNSSENTIAMFATSRNTSSGVYATDEFTITKTTPLIVSGYNTDDGKVNQSATIDFIYLVKTGEYEEPTGIRDVKSSIDGYNVYNINGLRIEKKLKDLPKGIYIVNGQKVIKK